MSIVAVGLPRKWWPIKKILLESYTKVHNKKASKRGKTIKGSKFIVNIQCFYLKLQQKLPVALETHQLLPALDLETR